MKVNSLQNNQNLRAFTAVFFESNVGIEFDVTCNGLLIKFAINAAVDKG
jgi:hypothetical protein